MWFRSLKEQIIVDSCYDEAIAIAILHGSSAADATEVAERSAAVKQLLEKLPAVNQIVIQHLATFLSKLVRHCLCFAYPLHVWLRQWLSLRSAGCHRIQDERGKRTRAINVPRIPLCFHCLQLP